MLLEIGDDHLIEYTAELVGSPMITATGEENVHEKETGSVFILAFA
jgi:hypothetical protein